MSILREVHAPDVKPATAAVDHCPIPLPLLDNIDHVQGILIRWRKQSACLRDLQVIAEKLGPVLTHVGRHLNGLDPTEGGNAN